MAQYLKNKNILVGISGGIASYKVPDLVRRLKDQGADVRVVMTASACEFITPLTLQAVSGHRVGTSLLDENAEAGMGHIELARWADAIVIAPITADTLARMASGRADDLLSTLVRATNAPLLFAPAMNQAMWSDRATQNNVSTLTELGVHWVGPADGEQACGDIGSGRMSESLEIVEATIDLFKNDRLFGKSVVITAGPTQEAIDPVRYLSNHSSGKMGFALATAAAEAGAAVTLIAGPVHLPTPEKVNCVNVTTAEEMLSATLEAIEKSVDLFIAAAAVADYRVAEIADQKIKKDSSGEGEKTMMLSLVENPDVLATVAQRLKEQDRSTTIVGFAAETENLIDNAKKKLAKKRLDYVVANDVSQSDIGFGADINEVSLVSESETTALPKQSKAKVAKVLIEMFANRLN